MIKRLLLALTLLSQVSLAAPLDLPAVTYYNLDFHFRLKEQRLAATATMTVTNSSTKSRSSLPFLLYRLLTVERVEGPTGTPFPFRQNVVQLADEPSLQANALVVELPSTLRPGDSVTIHMQYGGFMFGYPEVMAYVRDQIDENYSLLRPDAFAYPILTEPTFAGALAAAETRFTYDVRATVPHGYVAACGGRLDSTTSTADSTTFLFRSKIPTWRIDVAVAKFSILKQPDDQLAVYHLPSDSAGALRVLNATADALKFYSNRFGRPPSFKGFTIIEITDGWGSQASDYYCLQTAAAFRDSSGIPEVYHEVGHSWNATPAPSVRRCRYFDEAFASFFEALAIREFRGEKEFADRMERSRSSFAKRGRADSEAIETPIAGYGAKELGSLSYTKGAWSLYVLHRVVGEQKFQQIIHAMLTQPPGETIDFDGFQKTAEAVTGRSLSRFFQEWIFGTESSNLLIDKVPIERIAKRY
jgi:hypothetical protein